VGHNVRNGENFKAGTGLQKNIPSLVVLHQYLLSYAFRRQWKIQELQV
jgi:hypothetical protein